MAKRGQAERICERLRAARELAGISCRTLDALAGITPGHTSAIEAGRRGNPESRTAIALAHALGLTIDWLLLGDGDAPTEMGVRAAVAKATRAHQRTGTTG